MLKVCMHEFVCKNVLKRARRAFMPSNILRGDGWIHAISLRWLIARKNVEGMARLACA